MATAFAPFAQRLWGAASERRSEVLRIDRRNPAEPVPLSFSQQPMWFAELLDPGTPVYNAYEAFRLRGPVDARQLQAALDAIVHRHEILRTSFLAIDGQPVQQVLPSGAFPLEEIDGAGGDELALDLCDRFIRRPFDFERGPMARALLVRVQPNASLFVIAMHHIVRDGWAIGVLLRELSELMRALAANAEPQLPHLNVQFGDFAAWQNRLARDGAFERQRTYWARRLAGAPALLDIAGDRARSARDDARGDVSSISVDRPTVDALRALAADGGATFFMTLAAAFQTLLHRYSGSDDVVTGFPVSGRVLPETEPLVGCFINTAVLRTGFERDLSFRALLARIRSDAREAYDHQDLPFEKLVEELRPERVPGQTPVIQTLVTLMNPRRPKLELPGVAVEPLRLRPGTAKLDLALEMAEHAGGLTTRLEYRSALYDDVTAVRMLGHFQRLLHGIAAHPDRPVDLLPILTDDERTTIVSGWNPPCTEAAQPLHAHELIEGWARRTPHVLALESEPERLSYAELNRRADELSARLRAAGAGRHGIVAIYLERSPQLVIAVLAALKSGAAYLPLDTAYPPARITFMLADAHATVVVTDASLADRPALANAARILVDEAPRAVAVSCEPAQRAEPSDLAYVIYTSGTTGTPKGVAIEHAALNAYIVAATATYPLTQADRVLQMCSPSFDVIVKDIFVTFAQGATLVLRSEAMMESPAAFMRTCAAWNITALSPPTAYWHELAGAVATGDATIPPTLRQVAVGGETISPGHVVRWQQHSRDDVALYNTYGPTETTVACTSYRVPPAREIEAATSVSIGRPLSNSRCYVLDEHRALVPANVPGDLYVGGASVGRGYLGDPSLTAARFVADPFSAVPGARMYRTGDRARFLADGTLDFLGRVDRQLKLRGFRVEPAEVEAVLLRHPAVRESYVDVDGDTDAQRLLAFVAIDPARPVTARDVRAFAGEELPTYMVPARVVAVDAIPMTPGMKVDRHALRALVPHEADVQPEHVAPRTPVERAIAAIWSEVLGVNAVGVTDDFFDLGGHSLPAAAVVARISKRFGVRIPLRKLFEERTVAALSAIVETAPALSVAGGREKA